MEVSPSVREDKELALTKVGRRFVPPYSPSPTLHRSLPPSPSCFPPCFSECSKGGGGRKGGREEEGHWIYRKWVDGRRSRGHPKGYWIMNTKHGRTYQELLDERKTLGKFETEEIY